MRRPSAAGGGGGGGDEPASRGRRLEQSVAGSGCQARRRASVSVREFANDERVGARLLDAAARLQRRWEASENAGDRVKCISKQSRKLPSALWSCH